MAKDQKGIVQTLFQIGTQPGSMHKGAKAAVTVAPPPGQAAPGNPGEKVKGKRELDNPGQYGKPPVTGPDKPNQKAPSFEHIVSLVTQVRDGEMEPEEAARQLVQDVDEAKKKDKDKKDEDEDEDEEKAETKESVDATVAKAAGSSVGGVAAPPKQAAPDGPGIRFDGKPEAKNFLDDVKAWLDSVPEAKKMRIGDQIVHRTGPNSYQLDDITSTLLTRDAAALAIVSFAKFGDKEAGVGM